ncbi:MAG: kinase/pyrophosphorylase [Acidobacteriota bacterium]|nr:MAG: kinase/pyrophosphorylase [Acidobacteriota bacterium]
MDKPKRSAFIISDGTGITAESFGHSLLTQFPSVEFATEVLTFVDTAERAEKAVVQIKKAAKATGAKPIVFATLVNEDLRAKVAAADCVFYDLFETYLQPLEEELGTRSSHKVGVSHGIVNHGGYASRIGAMNFALETDDGMSIESYKGAQIVILGVSRSGKTPTCIYLALQYGIYAANYPLTDSELDAGKLPEALVPFREKLFGLTIDPYRLQQIRQERYNRDSYASSRQCQYEIAQAEAIYRKARIKFLNSTQMSVEELGAKIMQETGMKRQY